MVEHIPFNHPLSPADLEELRTELKARRDEERDILLVCLGKELACDTWLIEWNRLRRRGDVPNKIEVIELRTDPKYGKFIAHKPAQAKVEDRPQGRANCASRVENYIQPSILDGSNRRTSLLTHPDHRLTLDGGQHDDGPRRFNSAVSDIALTDLPEREANSVEKHRFTLPAPMGGTNVAREGRRHAR